MINDILEKKNNHLPLQWKLVQKYKTTSGLVDFLFSTAAILIFSPFTVLCTRPVDLRAAKSPRCSTAGRWETWSPLSGSQGCTCKRQQSRPWLFRCHWCEKLRFLTLEAGRTSDDLYNIQQTRPHRRGRRWRQCRWKPSQASTHLLRCRPPFF